jgi:hypothetical protein
LPHIAEPSHRMNWAARALITISVHGVKLGMETFEKQ